MGCSGAVIDISKNYCRVGILPAIDPIFAAMSNREPLAPTTNLPKWDNSFTFSGMEIK
jgi:hypothetical protein